MGIFDVLSSIATGVLDHAQRQQAQALKKAGQNINDYEKKVSHAESHSGSMSDEQQAKIIAAREKLENNKVTFDEKTYENEWLKDEVEFRKEAERLKKEEDNYID